jgi:hypothetical protein
MTGFVLSHPFRDETAERMGHGNKMQVLRLVPARRDSLRMTVSIFQPNDCYTLTSRSAITSKKR